MTSTFFIPLPLNATQIGFYARTQHIGRATAGVVGVCVCMCGRENILRIRDLDGVCPGSVCADGQLLLADICISRGRPRVCVWMLVDGHI